MKPNVVYILADDMGYGDASCYNPEGKIPTPNIDRIAKEGLTFTEAHSTSAVCSPSRYSILTGRYCWRTLPRGLVGIYGDALIPDSRMTVAHLFRNNGYHTGCVGKWHLGMTWQKNEEGTPDFTKPVLEGPMVNGFDEYFGVDVPNWPPYTYIEGNMVTKQPDSWLEKPGTNDMAGFNPLNISSSGPAVEGWNLEQILPDITDRACRFITENTKKKQPFFLYFPMTSPHTPLAVTDEWKGKSGLNPYADFVMETDAMIGKVLDCLDENQIAGDTWVIFASDNGCAKNIGCEFLESQGHFPSYHWRGYKSETWDGGHRIPMVMRWPKAIEAGRTYDKVVSLGDFMATAAEILSDPLPDSAGEDSISFYPVMTGKGDTAREVMIQHSVNGKFAIRKGKWKLILCAGSGGFVWEIDCSHPSDGEAEKAGLPRYQLYDMEADPSEKTNLYGDPRYISLEKELLGYLEDYIARGRSTPGADQKNDIECIIDPKIGGTPVFED